MPPDLGITLGCIQREGHEIPLPLLQKLGTTTKKRDRPGGTIVRDDMPAPESTKKVSSFSLGPTFKFIKSSL
jgi:hypothetical protein